MPTYEYKCDVCGVVFDRFQHFSEEPVRLCPECGGGVHRVIQPVGIIFKGKGFYVTDHKGSGPGLLPKSDKEAKPEGISEERLEQAKAAVTEAKPSTEAAKPEAKAQPKATT